MVRFSIHGLEPTGPTCFLVGGKHIRGVTGYKLEGNFRDRIPQLTLDFNVIVDDPIEGDGHVYVSARAREGLIALGWTPPEDQPEEVKP